MGTVAAKQIGIVLIVLGLMLWRIPAGSGASEREPVEEEEIVVSATMTEKIARDVPGSVEIITSREIEEMNAETVADAVVEATGLLVTTESGRQKRPSIRGTGNRHTLVLLDGRRLAAGFNDLTGMEQIPVDLIKRIEVVRGPASALYGSDAIGGVINIITRRPPKDLSAGVTAQYGQSTYKEAEQGIGRAFVGQSWDRLGLLLAGGYWKKNDYDRDGITPDDGDETEFASAGGRFSYAINDGHELMAGFEAVEKTSVGLRDMQQMDRERDAEDHRLNYFLEYDGKFTPLSSLMLRANHSEHENDIDFDPPTSMVPGTEGDETDAERELDQMEARFTAMAVDRHLVTIGAEYRDESREDASGLDDDVQNLSFYVQDEYQVWDHLYLALSLRWDDHSDFGSEWTPRVSMTYNIFDHLRMKASYGQGFRAPGIMELYVPAYQKRGKLVYEPNSDLDPETSESYEAGIEGEYKAFQGRITVFQNEIEDLIEAVYYASTGSGKKRKDYYQYQNIAEASTRGVELEWRVKLPAGFDLTGNLAYLDSEDETTGEDLEGRPDYKGTVKLAYRHPASGLRANIRINHIGERYYSAETEDDVTWVSVYFSRDLSDTCRVFAGIDNVFNNGEDEGLEPAYYYAGVSLSY
jgi:outer membrane receptor for ferrienterochelin and colicins